MDVVDIISLTIGAITVILLIALLVMMRTRYALIPRDQQDPTPHADDNATPTGNG